jgi:hypothetical protein
MRFSEYIFFSININLADNNRILAWIYRTKYVVYFYYLLSLLFFGVVVLEIELRDSLTGKCFTILGRPQYFCFSDNLAKFCPGWFTFLSQLGEHMHAPPYLVLYSLTR